MFDLAWRDAVEQRAVWAGAVLVAAVTSMFTTACFNALLTGATAPQSAFNHPEGRDAILQTAGNLLLLSGGPAILVLATVLGTLVTQTGPVHALWRLGGAAPHQVVRMFGLQVVLACICGAVIGALLALPFQGVANSLLGRGMATGLSGLSAMPVLLSVLCSVLVVTVWGVIAGFLPALRAAATSPLKGREPDRPEGFRWRALLLALLFVVFVQVPLLVPLLMVRAAGSVVQGVVMLLPAGQALVITVALFSPWFLPGAMRVWTAIPGLRSWTPWRIARHMAVTRAGQSTATVVPLMVGVGLFASFNIVGTAARNTRVPGSETINLFDGVLMLTPIGAIGAIGSAAVVFMASRQRSDDLTALRVAGASPTGSLAVFCCEAVIYVVTALLVAVVPALGTCGLLLLALGQWGLPLDLGDLELTGSVVVAAIGSVATLGIVTAGGVRSWRLPLATALAER